MCSIKNRVMTLSIYFNRFFVISAGLALLLTSCRKDELASKELAIYVPGEYGTVSNAVQVPFVHTPLDVIGNTTVKIAALATREVPADVSVTITPDLAMVDKYNRDNNTSRLPLPDNTYKIINPGKQTIRSGSFTSDSLQIEITGAASLTNPNGYLLPLKIAAVESEDKGVKISDTRATVYIEVTYAFNNIQASQTPLAGTLAVRTGWLTTVSNTTTGALGPAMLDGNNSTAWRSSNSSTAAKWVILDMGSQQTVTALRLTPNYVSVSENPTTIVVSTSSDNINYFVQGTWKGTGPVTGSSATNPDFKGINFIAPVQARYYRLDITSQVSGSRVGIGELNAVQ
jgi:hypothetical protein